MIRMMILALTLLSSSVFAFPGMNQAGDDPALQRFVELTFPQQLETISITDAKGDVVDLAQYKGKMVVLNLWATWCPPCVRELPSLARFRAQLEQQDAVVLPVAIDQDPAVVPPFLADLGLPSFTTLYDTTNEVGRVLPTDLVPATFILNEKGELVAFVRSFVDWDNPKVQALVEKYLPQ
ncbi:Thiol-disulfide isomerase or thioredoxin [Ferrimonas sediminum]|uniref:Thiol-disulfide isomerase or thioredoxin n=1 Tax=Ferrimonas sediminum TaxID=718193 RepID=A0A1G9B7Q4_9GAMM|nr:TlpA disulfide reductase family protein [Ferrimonas sediminum]SDK35134.1 Thiol-disulfide isomerase or thioredoxin [Ferrimonas sediminum]